VWTEKEGEWVNSAAKEDAVIYAEVNRDLTSFAASLVGPDDAPDAVSTVVARALAAGGFARLDDPRAYLMRSVHNECRSIHRMRRRDTLKLSGLAEPRRASPEPSSRVVELVEALPFKQRCATHLVYWMGYTPTDAARLIGVRPATLRRYLYLARKKMKEALDVTDDRRASNQRTP
jgi:RNA polymerase sigma-70 factor (ECF subfamily)